MLRIGFKKPGDNWLAQRIATHDAPGLYCHAAVIFDDGAIAESHIEDGVRFHDYPIDPGQWDLVDVSLTPEGVAAVRRFCELAAGDDYDTIGVLHHIIGFCKQDPEAWYCSELCHAALSAAGFFPIGESHEVTPNQLYRLLTFVDLPTYNLPPIGATPVSTEGA